MLIGAVFVFLHILEAASPDVVGEDPNPATDATLIMTGVVLLALIVVFVIPWRVEDRSGAGDDPAR